MDDSTRDDVLNEYYCIGLGMGEKFYYRVNQSNKDGTLDKEEKAQVWSGIMDALKEKLYD